MHTGTTQSEQNSPAPTPQEKCFCDLNRVSLSGHLGADPEFLSYAGGVYVKCSLGSTREYLSRTGEKLRDTTWVDCVSFTPTVVTAMEGFGKGAWVKVTAQLKDNSWVNEDAQKRKKHELTVFEVTSMLTKKGRDPQGN